MGQPILLRNRTPALVVLTALVAMLGVHLVLRTNDDLSPWKGGGFAMFSTVDSPGMRTVTVWADVAGVEEPVGLVGSWDDASRELRALPTAARTMALARGVASSTLVRRADGNLAPATASAVPVLVPADGRPASTTGTAAIPASSREAVVEVDRVRVDVMKLTYAGGVVRTTLLQSASADVAHDS
jgi:hypothetical protein